MCGIIINSLKIMPALSMAPHAASASHGGSSLGAVQGLIESITSSGSSQHGTVVTRPLQPTMATSNPVLSMTNLLHELDAAAQDVIGRVAAAQVGKLTRLLRPSSVQQTLQIMLRLLCYMMLEIASAASAWQSSHHLSSCASGLKHNEQE